MRNKLIVMTLLLLVATSVAGFASEKQYTIGATIWDMSNPFYSNFIEGLNDGAKEFNFNLLLRDGQGDPNTQVGIVRQFLAEKVDMIVIVPGDAQAVVPVIIQANQAGIPVIAANNQVGEGAEIVTFVGADDYYFGQQQARLLIEAIGEKGNVAYLMGELGTSAQVMRQAGFENVLADYPGIKIVASISDGWDSAKSLAATQDILLKHPAGTLDAIVNQGPAGVPGAKYTEQIGRKEVKWILGDYPRDVHEVIKEGLAYGTVMQDPYPQAFEALHMARLYLDGRVDEIPTPTYFLELPLVTSENVDEYSPVW
ncbi:MAG: sugar ABC transporter substrate-binding protein [Firmicutes bacterium]|nr:sugar ABC transporter substrate-binding protein [Bacillota bacterium]